MRRPTETKRRSRRPVAVALLVGALAGWACAAQNGSGASLEGEAALVITTDYQSGAYSAVRLSDRAVVRNVEVIHQDSVCRYDPVTGHPFVIGRLGADAIAVVDTEGDWTIVNEYSVGPGSNPQDIAVVSEQRAYVSLMGEDHLLVVHPTEGTRIGEVDLSAWADADGLPEASGMVRVGDSVYVAVLRLESFLPVNESYLVEIDADSGDIVADYQLAATPSGRLRYNETLERIVLVASGEFGNPDDGGIELFDPVAGQAEGLIVTEQQLGGDLVDVAIASQTVGFAVLGEMSGQLGRTKVAMFDPSTGQLTRLLEEADAWNHMYLELTPDGSELWLSERRMSSPGIRIFDAADGEELTEAPLDVGLPPFTICFSEYD